MRRITVITAFITALVLAGCANVNVTVKTDSKSPVPVEQDRESPAEADLPTEPDNVTQKRQSVAGPYGELSMEIPDDWECKICPLDNDEMSYGYYGFSIHPKDVKEGMIAIFCATRFGVCGTELKQEETKIAGKPARIGTYDNHKRWDFIVIGNEDPQIVATGGACDSWTDDQWDTVRTIVDSVELDPSVTAGGIWQYTPESENTDIGVSMDLSNITPVGATIHFYRFDTGKGKEMIYGDGFILEKDNEGKWEEVSYLIEDFGFNDIAYTIPQNDTSEIETNWEWLYGTLPCGTYRITKTVWEGTEGNYKDHELSAQFLIAGPAIKSVVESDFGTYYEMSDGTWMYDGRNYKYRLEITGCMNNAAKDSTFIYLSNIDDIPFDRAVMASGLSSNMADYFSPDEAVFVGWKE